MGDNDLSSGVVQFLPLLIIFAVYYLFIIRPRQKKNEGHGLWSQYLVPGAPLGRSRDCSALAPSLAPL
jgi:preprotein translocase subunit YajC